MTLALKLFSPDTGDAAGGGTVEPTQGAPASASGAPTPAEPIDPTLVPAAPVLTPPPADKSFVNPDGSFVENWTLRLPEEIRGDAFSLAKYKTVEELAKGTINQGKLIGRKGVFVPHEKSSPEEVAEFRKALGVPETPDGYEAKPEKLPTGIAWNDALAKPFVEIAHKHNIPKAALKELIATHIAVEQHRGNAMVQQAQARVEAQFKAGTAELEKTWGNQKAEKERDVRQVCAVLGIDIHDPGLSSPGVVKGLALVKRYISEDKLVQANGGLPSALNGPAMAKDIRTNPQNPYYQRYQSGDADIVQLARQYDTMK